jgi:uncharacterized membrane protein
MNIATGSTAPDEGARRVLLVGESWSVYSVHQKGFDTFYTSEYTEAGDEFIAALRDAGHEVARIPAHLIERDFPTSVDDLRAIADVVVVSDVGANSFLLSKDTFTRSLVGADRLGVLADFVRQGGGLLMIGGYMTFSGIDGKARWGRTPVGDILPVHVLDRDDRVELPAGVSPSVLRAHDVVDGLDDTWPTLLGLNEVTAKPDATTLAVAGAHPLVVIREEGQGRTAAFTSDLAPHWATPAFLEWAGYGILFDRLVRWAGANA